MIYKKGNIIYMNIYVFKFIKFYKNIVYYRYYFVKISKMLLYFNCLCIYF